jgi:hypothetical protein
MPLQVLDFPFAYALDHLRTHDRDCVFFAAIRRKAPQTIVFLMGKFQIGADNSNEISGLFSLPTSSNPVGDAKSNQQLAIASIFMR